MIFIRPALFIFLLLVVLNGSTQTRIGVSGQSGFNRIGLYYDAGFVFDSDGHEGKIGVRYYGPDYVFEKNSVGLSAGYKYKFTSGSWFFGPGVGVAFFDENKSSASLSLAEIVIQNTIGYELGNRFCIFSNLGIGAVAHQYSVVAGGTTGWANYVNYEFSLGFNYYWRVPADN